MKSVDLDHHICDWLSENQPSLHLHFAWLMICKAVLECYTELSSTNATKL